MTRGKLLHFAMPHLLILKMEIIMDQVHGGVWIKVKTYRWYLDWYLA